MAIRPGFIVLFLIFVTLGIYYPTIFAGANSLDDAQIINGYRDAEQFDLKGLFLSGGSGYYYRPLLGLTLVFDSIVWGMHESLMHLDNIIFHVVNVILVFFIAIRVARRYANEEKLLPLCAALLFAVHPINTESVNWISGRTDLLAGIFVLLSILLLLKSLQQGKIMWCAIASLAFLTGCFAKEVSVCALPGLLLIVLFYDQEGSLMQRLAKRLTCCAFLSAAAAVYFIFRYIAFYGGDTGMKTALTVNVSTFNFINTFRVILKVLGFYLKKIFIPWPLNFAIVNISDYYVILGIILILAIAYMLYKRCLISAFFLTSISVTAPALLVAFGKMAWTPLAERYLYIPCAIFCVAISVCVYDRLLSNGHKFRKSLYLILMLLFISGAYTTVERNIVWQNNVTLFQDTLRKSPNFFLVQNALAGALQQQQGSGEESKLMLLSMVAPEGHKRGGKLVDSNRARILMSEGDLVGAKRLLLRNIEDSGAFLPTIVEQIISIDMNLLKDERSVRKVVELRKEIVAFLLQLHEKSGDPFFFYRIGQFYLNIGNKKEAQHYFSKAYLQSPEGTHYKLAAKKLADKLK